MQHSSEEEPNVGILPTVKYFHANYLFGAQENNHQVGVDLMDPLRPGSVLGLHMIPIETFSSIMLVEDDEAISGP